MFFIVNNTATTIWARSGILEKGHNSAKFKPHTHKKERKKGTNKNIYIQSVHVNCVLCDNMYHQALPLHTDSLSPVVTIVNVKYLSIYYYLCNTRTY